MKLHYLDRTTRASRGNPPKLRYGKIGLMLVYNIYCEYPYSETPFELTAAIKYKDGRWYKAECRARTQKDAESYIPELKKRLLAFAARPIAPH